MREVTPITLNLQAPNVNVIVHAKEGDRAGRFINAKLVDGAREFIPPANAYFAVRYMKDDGHGGIYDTMEDNETPAVTVSGNIATIGIAEQMLTTQGWVQTELNIYDANETRISAFKFTVWVEETVMPDGNVESTEYFNILTHEIALALQAAGAAETVINMTVEAETLEPGEEATVEKEHDPSAGTLNLKFGIPKGFDGKTAYQSAVDGGYTGTEAEFNVELAGLNEAATAAAASAAAAAQSKADVQALAETISGSVGIDDDYTGDDTTWSSSKIQGELDEQSKIIDKQNIINDSVFSIVDNENFTTDYTNAVEYSEKINVDDRTTVSTTTNAYTNGERIGFYGELKKIKTNDTYSSSSYRVFVVKGNSIYYDTGAFSPTVENNEFSVPSGVYVEPGCVVCLSSLDGEIGYKNIGENVFIEVRMAGVTNPKIYSSPIIGGFNCTFDVANIKNIDEAKHSVTTGALVNGTKSGIAEYYERTDAKQKTTNTEIYKKTSTASNSTAYENGTVLSKGVNVYGIILNPYWTATTFTIVVIDSNDSVYSITEHVSTTHIGQEYEFNNPVFVPAGCRLLIKREDGNLAYSAGTVNDKKEYRLTGEVVDSPVAAGFDWMYKVLDVRLKENTDFAPSTIVETTDYLLPKCIDNAEPFTCIGRWFDYTKNGNTYKCTNNDGAFLLFKCSGSSSITIGFGTITEPSYTPYFAYSVDGGTFTRQLINNGTINIGDTDEHFVWVVIDGMGESDPSGYSKWNGQIGVYVTGIITEGTTHGVTPKNKQILSIGDSISEGINALGTGANANVNSATSCFTFKVARKLNALPLMCGYGGTAVVKDSGSFKKGITMLDWLKNETPSDKLEPDIVLLEHGYNDYSIVHMEGSELTEQDFIDAYEELIKRISIKYPGAPIICLIPFKQRLVSAIETAASGKSYCYVVHTNGWNISTSDSTHPDDNGHTKAANLLYEEIIKIFGKEFFI